MVWRLADARRRVEAVLAEESELVSDGFRDRTFPEFTNLREGMVAPKHLAGFCLSVEWLRDKKRTKYVNRRMGTTYGLKHRATRDVGYMGSGAFIAAAIDLGFTIQRIDRRSECHINIAMLPFDPNPPRPWWKLEEVFPLDYPADAPSLDLAAWLTAP